jgi:hypothetical protein
MEQNMDLRRPPTVRELEVGLATMNVSALALPSPV